MANDIICQACFDRYSKLLETQREKTAQLSVRISRESEAHARTFTGLGSTLWRSPMFFIQHLVFKPKRQASPIARPVPEPVPNKPSPIPLRSVSETEGIEFSPKTSQDELVSRLNLEKDNAAKVTRTYYLAQDLITERMGLAPEKNETHCEYFDRVTKNATYLKEPLQEIVELFELTRYTPNTCDAAQSRQAAEALLRLLKEIESRTKQTEQHSVQHKPLIQQDVRRQRAL